MGDKIVGWRKLGPEEQQKRSDTKNKKCKINQKERKM